VVRGLAASVAARVEVLGNRLAGHRRGTTLRRPRLAETLRTSFPRRPGPGLRHHSRQGPDRPASRACSVRHLIATRYVGNPRGCSSRRHRRGDQAIVGCLAASRTDPADALDLARRLTGRGSNLRPRLALSGRRG
jgi:hypothetical protein